MIEIKAPISGWHPATMEQATNYVLYLLDHITTMSGNDLIRYINEEKLKGTTVEELLKLGKKNDKEQVKKQLDKRIIEVIEAIKKYGCHTTIINNKQMTFQKIPKENTVFLSMQTMSTIGTPHWSYRQLTPKEMVKFLQNELKND